MSSFWKVCSFLCTQYLVGPPFAWITASMQCGLEAISLWHCSGVMEAQDTLIAAFGSFASDCIKYRKYYSKFFWEATFKIHLAQKSARATSLWMGMMPEWNEWAWCLKWNQHLHKACQQEEAWSALKCPGRWLRWMWTSESVVDQHQQMIWQPKSSLTVETSHWTSSHMDSVPLHSSSRLWDLDFQIKCKIYFHLKRGLWTTEQQSSYFSP